MFFHLNLCQLFIAVAQVLASLILTYKCFNKSKCEERSKREYENEAQRFICVFRYNWWQTSNRSWDEVSNSVCSASHQNREDLLVDVVAVVLNTNNLQSDQKYHDCQKDGECMLWHEVGLLKENDNASQNNHHPNEEFQKLHNCQVLLDLDDIKEAQALSNCSQWIVKVYTTFEVFGVVNDQVVDEAWHWPDEAYCK